MSTEMEHCMVDLETMSDKPYAAILSISAVMFNIETGETGDQFHESATLKSNLEAGLKVDPDTIMWWLTRSEQARRMLVDSEKKGNPVGLMLYNFRKFIEAHHPPTLQLWGNSNRFEFGRLEEAYIVFKQELPWKHRLERDVRTLVSFAPKYKKEEQFTGTEHYGPDDCLHEIKYVVKTYNHFTNPLKYVAGVDPFDGNSEGKLSIYKMDEIGQMPVHPIVYKYRLHGIDYFLEHKNFESTDENHIKEKKLYEYLSNSNLPLTK